MRVHARGTIGAITSLRLAEDILGEARARLPVHGAVGAELPDLGRELAQVDTTLAFARGRFNDAVSAYNAALRQFPTRLIAGLFQLSRGRHAVKQRSRIRVEGRGRAP